MVTELTDKTCRVMKLSMEVHLQHVRKVWKAMFCRLSWRHGLCGRITLNLLCVQSTQSLKRWETQALLLREFPIAQVLRPTLPSSFWMHLQPIHTFRGDFHLLMCDGYVCLFLQHYCIPMATPRNTWESKCDGYIAWNTCPGMHEVN